MTDTDGDEETLDPDSWAETRELGARMMEQLFDDLESVRSRPPWRKIPDEAKKSLDVAAPRAPQNLDSVYKEYRQHIEPYAVGNRHPKFWGWVIGGGTPVGILGDMLASSMNTNAAGFEQSSAYVEGQVLNWFKQVFGFPRNASGLLVSSGSMANLTALTVARDAILPSVVDNGLGFLDARPLIYASEEVHNSVDKSLGILGLGRSALRKVPTNEDFTMNIAALREMIASDRSSGAHPICVIGTAGTVATGAIDNLNAIADICAENKMWFHADGAFGAMAALSDKLRPLVAGMERADSLAFDLHKWLSVNFDGACVLVRDAEAHLRSFFVPASYLSTLTGGVAVGPYRYGELGPDLSRNFRALKAWMSIKTFGFDKYARMIEKNVAQAAHLASLVRKSDHLELVATVPLNVVCFRYVALAVDEAALDALNENILVRLQEDGLAVPSGVHIRDRFAIRVANVNHRTMMSDFEDLVRDVVRLGGELSAAKTKTPLQ